MLKPLADDNGDSAGEMILDLAVRQQSTSLGTPLPVLRPMHASCHILSFLTRNHAHGILQAREAHDGSQQTFKAAGPAGGKSVR